MEICGMLAPPLRFCAAMPAFPSLFRRRTAHPPLARALTWFLVAVCLALTLMVAALGWNARRQWLANAAGATVNLASSLAEHAEATIKQSDTVLREVTDRID